MNMQEVKEKATRVGVKPGKKSKAELIRNIQETEGNIPCFQTEAFSSCFEEECCWRPDCCNTR
ncbi:MAG: hypothetical protein Q8R88_07540 [Desulfoprunum sp.]|nr:hypothetical protein [Desulfoprunum sp.]